ncbi:Septum formation [Actinopolyspora xinjiangensis]|uniref:Septum formation n=1 Tax=Actinopolyspora xinjiangensis TaxID=405564 RepID=A0A1H0WQZ7_9ACTN|nr:septum formation family protein [Actinopolyspora xinjiangensis]SDP93114.1 Septum formation [Actinopolyspora xinjiangensis]
MAEPPESPPPEQSPGAKSSSRGGRDRRGAANARLVMLMAVLGALLVFTVAALLNWPSAEDPAPGLAEQPTTTAEPPEFEAPAGTCLNWTEPDASDISRVDCSEPHLFEMTGTAEVWARFGPDADFPSTEVLNELKSKRCADVARQYLEGGFDPNGRFEVSAFLPSKQSWNSGDRTLYCALQQPGPAGQLYRFTGKVDELDQSDTYEVGTCLGISGSSVSAPVECSQPHSVEMTGLADLSQEFKDGFPPTERQDEFLLTTCQKQLADYAGGKNVAEDKGLSLYWDNLSEESWQAGSRKVNCKVAATLGEDGGFAPVTGSVTGEISISDRPAPETTPRPGVPADGTR